MAKSDQHPRLISTTPRLSREEIAGQAFPQAFRGLSEPAVRTFLRKIADEFDALRARQEELLAEIDELKTALEERGPQHQGDLLSAVGDETARVLRSANESAEEIRRGAEERAGRILQQAQEEARAVRGQAEQAAAERTREADEAAGEMLREAERLAREMQESAEARTAEFEAETQAEAKAELESARRHSAELLAEAQAARDRLLNELTRRREALEAQLDALRTGRDRLLDAYRVVKRTLEEATEALKNVDTRAGGEAAGRQQRPGRVSPPQPVSQPQEEAPSAVEGAEGAEPHEAADTSEDDEEAESAVAETRREPAVGSLTLGELETPPEEPARREPSGVRVLRPEPESPGADAEDEAPEPTAADVSQSAEDTEGAEEWEARTAPREAGEGAVSSRQEEIEALFARLREEQPEPVSNEDAESVGADVGAAVPEESGPSADAAALQRRDEVLEPLIEELVRQVKRVVRDEQNVVLEAVREHRGVPTSDDVLPTVAEQDAAFTDAAAEVLAAACAAGEEAAGEFGAARAPNGSGERGRERTREFGAGLARELMDPLRDRLADTMRDAAAAAGGGRRSKAETSELVERVRARYREWKTERIDTAARGVLAAAFARGLYDALPDGVQLRWVPGEESPCPDCADNTLEPTTRGSRFPTGHPLPPAHRGCRCLVVPAQVVAPSSPA